MIKKGRNNPSQQPAFTLIEVVLVLAIAGLIFLMGFITLPALQRSQRNAQHKNNVVMGASMVRSYQANNRGRLPSFTGHTSFVVGNLDDDRPFNSYVQNSGLPEGIIVKVNPNFTQIGPETNNAFGRVFISPGTICAQPSVAFENGATVGVLKQGAVSIWTVLEEGANGLIYCQDV